MLDAGAGCWCWMLVLDAGVGCWCWMLVLDAVVVVVIDPSRHPLRCNALFDRPEPEFLNF